MRVRTYPSWYIVVIEVIVDISRNNIYGNQGEGLKSDEGQGITR